MQWTECSATELASAIAAGELRSADLVDHAIERVKRANPRLNAMVAHRFDDARREAETADSARAAGTPLGPLHGVPFSVKECFALSGMPNTAGIPSRRGVVARHDATAVARVRAAGAIPLGVTNTSEACMWLESVNPIYGRTNNPYNAARIAGGSSGGEGALIGAGASPFGIGSDVGGSIRMPAFFNGVFGHKPSSGLIPNTGQFPIATGVAGRYLGTGPLARRAEDLVTVVNILRGVDGQDHAVQDRPPIDPSIVQIADLRVFSVPDNGATPVHPELRDAQRAALDALRGMGARTEEHRFRLLKNSFDYWNAGLSGRPAGSFRAQLAVRRRDLLRDLFRRKKHELPTVVVGLTEDLAAWTPKRTARLNRERIQLRREIEALLGDNGVLLYPSYSQPAPRHGRPLLRPFHWVYTGVINVLELPATQVPLGLSHDGLPLGVQVIAAHGRDDLTLATALALEKAFGGWTAPGEPSA